MSFPNAEDFCRTKAGHLVSFSSGDEETNSLTNVFNAMDYYSEYFFWVGLRQSDEQDDGGYYWSDDTPYDYSFFASMLFLMTCDMTCDSRINICNFYLLLFFRWPTRYPWWLRQLCHWSLDEFLLVWLGKQKLWNVASICLWSFGWRWGTYHSWTSNSTTLNTLSGKLYLPKLAKWCFYTN